MTSPTWLSFFGSGFVVRPARARMSCITRLRRRRHWIGSRVKSSPSWLRFSDINMPGMDGLLLGEIKQRFPELPVMMVTAYGDDERRRQAAKCGAAEFPTKPVDFEYLKVRL